MDPSNWFRDFGEPEQLPWVSLFAVGGGFGAWVGLDSLALAIAAATLLGGTGLLAQYLKPDRREDGQPLPELMDQLLGGTPLGDNVFESHILKHLFGQDGAIERQQSFAMALLWRQIRDSGVLDYEARRLGASAAASKVVVAHAQGTRRDLLFLDPNYQGQPWGYILSTNELNLSEQLIRHPLDPELLKSLDRRIGGHGLSSKGPFISNYLASTTATLGMIMVPAPGGSWVLGRDCSSLMAGLGSGLVVSPPDGPSDQV